MPICTCMLCIYVEATEATDHFFQKQTGTKMVWTWIPTRVRTFYHTTKVLLDAQPCCNSVMWGIPGTPFGPLSSVLVKGWKVVPFWWWRLSRSSSLAVKTSTFSSFFCLIGGDWCGEDWWFGWFVGFVGWVSLGFSHLDGTLGGLLISAEGWANLAYATLLEICRGVEGLKHVEAIIFVLRNKENPPRKKNKDWWGKSIWKYNE